jgi:hypothetical protein
VIEAFVQAFELHNFEERLATLERHDAQLPPRANGVEVTTQP